MFKGEGIYHLTFAVNNRVPLLGRLRPLQQTCSDGHNATVDLTELGVTVYQLFNALRVEYPELQILGKQMMPDHFHAVVWMHEGFEGSVKWRGISRRDAARQHDGWWQRGRCLARRWAVVVCR